MAGNIKGITIEIGGNTTKLEKALKSVNTTSREVNKELREINTSLKFNPGNTELLAQKQRALGSAIENTKKKLEQLKTAQEQAAAALERGDIGQDEYDALRREIIKTENQLKSLEGQANQTAQSLKGISDKFMSAGQTLNSAGDTMTKNVTVPLVALGTLSTKSAAEFDSAMVGVRKTTELTDSEFAAMTQSIRDMAKELPASAVEIAGVAEAAGQLGIEKENITDFARTMIDLGETTNLTADEAANAFARFANITQMPQSEFDRLGSTVVELGNNMATTEAEITAMGLRLAATGKQVGLNEAEIMGLAAAMSSVGIEAEAGGSAMSTSMKRINSAVLSSMGSVNEEIEHFTKLLEGSGVTVEDVMLAYQQGDEALQALATTLGGSWDVSSLEEIVVQFEGAAEGVQGFADVAGMTAEEFSQLWKEKPTEALTAFITGLQEIVDSGGDVNSALKELGISGIRETDTLSRLAGAGELLGGAFDMANKAFEENTALTKEAELRYASFGSKFDMFKNKLTDVSITIGNVLLPAVTDIITKVGNFADKLSGADPELVKFAVKLAAIAAAIGPLLKLFGGIATVIGTVTGALATAMGGAAAATPAIAGLAAVFTKVGAAAAVIKGGLIAIGAAIGVSAGTVAVGIGAIIAAGVLLYTHWDEVKAKATEIWGNISEFFTNLWIGIKESWSEAWTGITTFLTELWTGFIESVSEIWEGLTTFFEELWNGITEIFSSAWEAISTTASTVWNGITSTLSTIWNGLKSVVETVFNAISTVISKVWETVKTATETVWNGIKTLVETVWNGLKTLAETVFDAIQTKISEIWDALKTKTEEIWNGLKTFVETTWNNIKTKAVEVFEAIQKAISDIWDNVKKAAEEKWESIKTGISTIWDNIKTAAEEKFDNIMTAISDIWDNIKKAADDKWDEIKKAMIKPVEDAKTAISDIIEKIKGFFTNLELKLPEIQLPKLPKLNISGKFGWNPPSVPSLSWYDKGGIFKSPTIIGVGEKRPEIVGALEDFKDIVDRSNREHSGNKKGDVIITGNTFVVRQESDIKKIAEELNKLQQKTNRGMGLMPI